MSKQVQFRRGATAVADAFTGAVGEIFIDTTLKEIRLHDGSTAGGKAFKARTIDSVFGRTGAVVAASNDYTWAQIDKTTSSLADLTTRSASDLSSGTLPDGRFPATLPAASGVNLTALNASSLDSGTVPDARFPATLPALSGVNLTALNASNLSSGTVNHARLGTGGGGSSKFLREDNTWQTIAGGGDMLAANNLSDVASVSTARTNLSVYSIAQVDSGFATSGINTNLTSITGLTGTMVLTKNVAATPDHGFLITNTTPATVGNQKYSPAIRFSGQGWKTNATAGSQAVDFRAYLRPIQGTANPGAQLVFDTSVNGGAFSDAVTFTQAGGIILGSGNFSVTPTAINFVDGATTIILNANSSEFKVSDGSDNPMLTIDRSTSDFTVYGATVNINSDSNVTFGGAASLYLAGNPSSSINLECGIGGSATLGFVNSGGDEFSITSEFAGGLKVLSLSTTMIHIDGSGNMGFFGAAPAAQQSVSAAASDPATTQTLANSLRTALINLGLAV